jgi:hypothetical protein
MMPYTLASVDQSPVCHPPFTTRMPKVVFWSGRTLLKNGGELSKAAMENLK